MTEETFEILLAGVGGQGIIFAGQILMESALKEGYRVYGFEMHGMARRGGAVSTHIRFGHEVYSPLIPLGKGQLLTAFEPGEALRHVHFMSGDGTVLLNSAPVVPVSVSAGESVYPTLEEIQAVLGTRCKNILTFDATSLAEDAGNPITMNAVMLGAICASKTLPVSKKIFLEAMEKRTPSRLLETNIAAFENGYSALD